MKTHTIALAPTKFASIHLLHGGREIDAIEESLKVTLDLRNVLQDKETILYINTLVHDSVLREAMGKRFDHGIKRKRVEHVTLLGDQLIAKLMMIEQAIKLKGIRYLVLNGYEFGAMTQRHRLILMRWIKDLRDFHHVTAVVVLMRQPNSIGCIGMLRYMADSISEIGQYVNATDGLQRELAALRHERDERQAVMVEEMEKEMAGEDPSENDEEFTDLPDVASIASDQARQSTMPAPKSTM